MYKTHTIEDESTFCLENGLEPTYETYRESADGTPSVRTVPFNKVTQADYQRVLFHHFVALRKSLPEFEEFKPIVVVRMPYREYTIQHEDRETFPFTMVGSLKIWIMSDQNSEEELDNFFKYIDNQYKVISVFDWGDVQANVDWINFCTSSVYKIREYFGWAQCAYTDNLDMPALPDFPTVKSVYDLRAVAHSMHISDNPKNAIPGFYISGVGDYPKRVQNYLTTLSPDIKTVCVLGFPIDFEFYTASRVKVKATSKLNSSAKANLYIVPLEVGHNLSKKLEIVCYL
tara:strand:- start:309 stop:1169 length:861 start_codon:yes stop_codon:yes gene_type:complete